MVVNTGARAARLRRGLGLLGVGSAIFTFNTIWVIFSLTVFLLPALPLMRLARPGYKARPCRKQWRFS